MIDFTPRLYQETIFAKAVSQNTLVVLPTGLGKTNIFLMIAAHRLKMYPRSKILLLGPTRPLIDQYLKVFRKYFRMDDGLFSVFTGTVSPKKREELWKTSQVIFSTPQGLENDIISGRIKLDDVSLMGFDEAHRAVGEYSYVFVADRYQKTAKHPLIIGMTASPGSDMEKIEEVISNLRIEHIEIRSDQDSDVKKYVRDVRVKWVAVEFPDELKRVHHYLTECLRSKLAMVKEFGLLGSINPMFPSRKELLGLQASLQGELAHGNKNFSVLKSLSLAAEAMKVQHALELLETQSVASLNSYIEDINQQSRTTKTKAVLNLVSDVNFRSAAILTRKLIEQKTEHPKQEVLTDIVKENITGSKKAIIFTQYRDTGTVVASALSELDGIDARLFVGQAKKRNFGLSQKQQLDMIQSFRNNEFNVLVSSSVGEEGLDVPQVDYVIFYEPIPSAIRHIQRKGRTGRQESGNVIILFTKGTRDEVYRWASSRKEKKMYSLVEKVRNKLQFMRFDRPEKQETVSDILVYADHREKGSRVIKELIDHGVKIRLERLDVADYILSNRCGVEFKTIEDFVDSLIDGRLIQQVKDLKTNFEKPVIMIEGTRDIYSVRNVHPNAIRGLIATISVSFGVPMIYTKNQSDSAEMMLAIARREQIASGRDFSLHQEKHVRGIKEMQEYIIGSLPGVGGTLSKSLLKEFGSVLSVLSASADELKKVEKIGEKKAKKIHDIVRRKYHH